MEQVLIAGCGRIGRQLGTRLAETGYSVWGINRTGSLPKPMHCIKADLSQDDPYIEQPFDYVIYTAAADSYNQTAYQTAYLSGLKKLVAQLNKAPKLFIFTSSTAVYGNECGEWVDEYAPTEPNSFSGELLLKAEHFLKEQAFKTTIVRFSGIYGPEHTQLLRQIKERTIQLSMQPFYTNRIHSEDCVRLFEFLIKNVQQVSNLYIGTDSTPVEKNQLIHWLEDKLGLPRTQAISKVPSKRGNKRCSNKRLLLEDFKFKYPSFELGYKPLIMASASI
jgi:nucleoside-diphosphate-sugar epimerase